MQVFFKVRLAVFVEAARKEINVLKVAMNFALKTFFLLTFQFPLNCRKYIAYIKHDCWKR